MNNYREEMKKKICNFFNIVYAGRKIIPGGALILADLRNVIVPAVKRLIVGKNNFLLEWLVTFTYLLFRSTEG